MRFLAQLRRSTTRSACRSAAPKGKLLLARLEGRWQLPLEGAISSHILKPEPEGQRTCVCPCATPY